MSEFSTKVLELVSRIPEGKVTTYKELAKAAGSPGAARAVGNALNKNPHPVAIPCHRVVRISGDIGGYVLGQDKKEFLLKKEGISIKNRKITCLERVNYKYP